MKSEIPRPRVQHCRHTEHRAQAPFVLTELEQGAGRRGEQQVEENSPVAQRQWAKLMRQREDDVEVVRGQDAFHALLNPRGLSQSLALRAVPVAARVVRGSREPAPIADVHVSAEDGSPADLDGTHRRPLLGHQRVRLAIGLAVSAEDVRNLKARPPLPALGEGRPMLVHRALPENAAFFRAQQIERALAPSDVFATHLRVPSRRLYRRVAKEFLDDANVRAGLEEMSRESVSKRMHRDVLGEATASDDLLEHSLHRAGRDRPARDHAWE
jgi:hypothetical protein